MNTPTIQWSDDLSTGIAVIDGQHQRIISYINDLGQARCPQGVAETLGELLDYTLSHFEFEEALMEEAGFDGLEEHKLTHDTFRARIEAFASRHARGEDISDEILALLTQWLYNHIAEDDGSYAPYIRQQQASEPEKHQSWMRRLRRRFSD